jgi:hypothetical protein
MLEKTIRDRIGILSHEEHSIDCTSGREREHRVFGVLNKKPSRGAGVSVRLFQVVGRCRCGLVEIQEESLAAVFL